MAGKPKREAAEGAPVGRRAMLGMLGAGAAGLAAAPYLQLRVTGLVDRPKSYTLDQLRAMPQTRVVHDVVCTDGWRVEKTPFDGVKLADILDDAGVRSPGAAIRFTCFDGAYSESLTLEQARRSDVLVALNMQDKPITHEHGGPVRLYVAPMYFYKSAKWLSGISVTDKVVPGYWEERGYAVDGWLDDADRHSDAA
jgi:DMSO/TMAO reductase YedYZ molybdopterin-dependent catalytic subunit